MIKIRITGLPDEIGSFLNQLKRLFFISNESKLYKDSNSKFARVYIDIEKRGNENE